MKHDEIVAESEKTLVLFIHGLSGSSEKTWSKFPGFLEQNEEFTRKYQIGFFSYPTMLVRIPFGRKPPTIQELAAGLRTQIENRYADFPRIVLVCHSLGGLIARKYLLDEFKAKRRTRVQGIVLFAVPNNGADLAGIANTISPWHNQIRQLCREADLIELLNEDWFTMGLPEVVRAKYVTGTQDRIVDRISAKAVWGNPDVEIIVGKGHIDIVKPERSDDLAVIILRRFLKSLPNVPMQVAQSATPGSAGPNGLSQASLETSLNAQNQPVFEARVQGLANNAGVCDQDHIVVRNVGDPISQVQVTRLSVFNARYYDMRHAPVTRTIPTLGYYNASIMTGNALGEVYRTDDTRHRLRMHRLLNLPREMAVDGYSLLLDFRHYLQISYHDRGDQRRTRSMEVSESGYTGLSDGEWNGIQQAASASEYFDFDAKSDDDFLRLVGTLLGRKKSLIWMPNAFSPERLSKTMSNPKYAADIFKLDRTYDRHSILNENTVIIVVGSNMMAELLDRQAAELLRDHIDRRGGEDPYRRGIVISHDAWYDKNEAAVIGNNPVIAIGGPKTNRFSAEFDEWKPTPPSKEGKYQIPATGPRIGTGFFRTNQIGLPQVGLWGSDADSTRKTVEYYFGNEKGLTEFLEMCWK